MAAARGLSGVDPVPRKWEAPLREAEQISFDALREIKTHPQQKLSGRSVYFLSDVIHWLAEAPANSIHAVVTDPPYGMIEYEQNNQDKLRSGKGGVWRIPPSFDGVKRSPLPRFTSINSKRRAYWRGISRNCVRFSPCG